MKTDMNRKRYRNQYEPFTKIDTLTGKESRGYRYIGSYYHLTADNLHVRAVRRWITWAVFFFWIDFISGGFINAPGSRSVWVLPFFLLSVFPGLYAGMSVWNLCRLPESMTVIQKEESLDSMKNSAWGIVVLSILASAGSLVVLLTGAAFGQETEEALFLGLSLLRLIMGWSMQKKLKGLTYEKITPPPMP